MDLPWSWFHETMVKMTHFSLLATQTDANTLDITLSCVTFTKELHQLIKKKKKKSMKGQKGSNKKHFNI